jgi:hypothetical protein
MASWNMLRRRAADKSAPSNRRQQKNTLRSRLHRNLRIEQFEERVLLSISAAWTAIGPSPIDYGQTENVASSITSTSYLNEVAGEIVAVAAHPTNPDILYVGTANGGIWYTGNATSDSPTWIPKTDLKTSLSISSLAFDLNDPTGGTLVAGIGRYSDSNRTGGALTGILRTTDGGANWTELDGNGVLDGKNCISIAARGNTILVARRHRLRFGRRPHKLQSLLHRHRRRRHLHRLQRHLQNDQLRRHVD